MTLFASLLFIISSIYQLRLEIDKETLTLILGIGLILMKYLLSDIASIEVVFIKRQQDKMLFFSKNGWSLHLNSQRFVKIALKQKAELIQLGFDQADEIAKEITKRLELINRD